MQRPNHYGRFLWLAVLAAGLWSTCLKEISAQERISQGSTTKREPWQEHRVIVRYHIDKTAGGLINQMLCHIGAFLLAIPLRAEVVLPGALSRSTYATKWWQQEWHPEPLDSLLDVKGVIRYWHQHGVVVYEARHYQSMPLWLSGVDPTNSL